MAENTNTERGYPPLPDPDFKSVATVVSTGDTPSTFCTHHITVHGVNAYSEASMRAYVDADRKARASLSLPAAGQEPVATVFTMEALTPGAGLKYHATIHKPLPAGTKLYAAPQPAVAAGWPLIARALDEWHEDDGPVMWWAWNGSAAGWAGEPAWCGTPNSSDWPGYHTHWTPHPALPPAPSTEGESNG